MFGRVRAWLGGIYDLPFEESGVVVRASLERVSFESPEVAGCGSSLMSGFHCVGGRGHAGVHVTLDGTWWS